MVDALGNEVKIPTTKELGDWEAVCQKCGYKCGGTFGSVPNEDDRKYVACPFCNHSGEPNIKWTEIVCKGFT